MLMRKIAVVTGARAEYGLLKPVMEAIRDHPRLELQVLVTGMHLLRRFGYTIDAIQADGWPIAARVRLQGEKDEVIGQARGLGRAISRLAENFHQLGSTVVLVLGDRIEAFAAAAAATASGLVLAHIHGGDAAPGVQDDAWRDAITKLAHLHFPASMGAKKRLLALGEAPFRVHLTGSPALDNLRREPCRDAAVLNRWAGFDTRADFLLVVQHPAGGSARQEEIRMAQTLRACADFSERNVVIYPNSDPGHSGILKAIGRYAKNKIFFIIPSLPRPVYLGLLSRARALVGNSSSGIIEAGFLGAWVINIGPRQHGRERGPNVRDVDYGTTPLGAALSCLKPGLGPKKYKSIYGNGAAGRKIAAILADVTMDERLRQKRVIC